MLTMLKKVLFGGNVSAESRMLKDLSPRDWASLVPLSVFIIVLGIRPGILLDKVQRSLDEYWSLARPTKTEAVGELKAPLPRIEPSIENKDSHS